MQIHIMHISYNLLLYLEGGDIDICTITSNKPITIENDALVGQSVV